MKRAISRTARKTQIIVMRIHLNLLQIMNLQVLKGEVNQKKEVSGRLKLYKISKTVYERKNDQKRTF